VHPSLPAPPSLPTQKYAGLLYDVTAGGVPLKEAAIAAAKASGVDLEKVGVARGLIAAAKASGVDLEKVDAARGGSDWLQQPWPPQGGTGEGGAARGGSNGLQQPWPPQGVDWGGQEAEGAQGLENIFGH